MERRRFIGATISMPFAVGSGGAAMAAIPLARVRAGDPGWPSAARWDRLREQVGGRLVAVQSPFDVCRSDPTGTACRELFRNLKNPYAIGDDVALTQTTGWADAWTSQPSAHAVLAESAADVAATVSFAGENNLRLVVKGNGHSYLGTSCAPDSLLIWTRRMNTVTLHDGFMPQGRDAPPLPAVPVGAGPSGCTFRRGVKGRGGLGSDFVLAEHSPHQLAVTTHRGVIFASYAHDMESLADYLGPDVLREFEATFDGRKLSVLGHYRHSLPGNWKLYHENLKDPYRATLLHTFLVTFGLLVAGNKSLMLADAPGGTA
jgi:hypothetical protein